MSLEYSAGVYDFFPRNLHSFTSSTPWKIFQLNVTGMWLSDILSFLLYAYPIFSWRAYSTSQWASHLVNYCPRLTSFLDWDKWLVTVALCPTVWNNEVTHLSRSLFFNMHFNILYLYLKAIYYASSWQLAKLTSLLGKKDLSLPFFCNSQSLIIDTINERSCPPSLLSIKDVGPIQYPHGASRLSLDPITLVNRSIRLNITVYCLQHMIESHSDFNHGLTFNLVQSE